MGVVENQDSVEGQERLLERTAELNSVDARSSSAGAVPDEDANTGRRSAPRLDLCHASSPHEDIGDGRRSPDENASDNAIAHGEHEQDQARELGQFSVDPDADVGPPPVPGGGGLRSGGSRMRHHSAPHRLQNQGVRYSGHV